RRRQFRLHLRRRSLELLRFAEGVRPSAHPRAALRGVHPPRAHLRDPPDRQHHLEQVAAGLRPRSRRRARLRALRRLLRSTERHRWRRDMDSNREVTLPNLLPHAVMEDRGWGLSTAERDAFVAELPSLPHFCGGGISQSVPKRVADYFFGS